MLLSRSGLSAPGPPRFLPLSLSRTYHTTRSQRAHVFPSQLNDPSAAAVLSSLKTPRAPQTLTEKIVQRYSLGLSEGQYVKAGDYVTLSPAICMTHDNSWPTALKFMSIGASQIYNKQQVVMTLDHDVQNKSESNLKKYRQIEEFAKKQGVAFYPAGRGIGHQIMVEEGFAYPGTLAVASDSHSNMYGGVGCLGTPVVRTDAASVTFTGVLPQGVTGKDVIVALCGILSNDEVLNHAIEFTGSEDTMGSLPVDARLTIANMTTEWGKEIQQYAKYIHMNLSTLSRKTSPTHSFFVQADREYRDNVSMLQCSPGKEKTDLEKSAHISGPNSVKISTPVEELAAQNIKIDKAYLVSCTNARSSDFAAAAKVFKDAVKQTGRQVRIANSVKFYIAAASIPEQLAAEDAGDWQALLDAGATPLPSGCGPCIGLGTGLLEPGEVGISASNRNFKGRMGSTEAKAYLASPEVVAASALCGKISGPGWYQRPEGFSGVTFGEGHGLIGDGPRLVIAEEAMERVIGQLESKIVTAEKDFLPEEGPETTQEARVPILSGFPEKELVFADADNLNTDAIYPGKYTYRDDITVEKMAEVCMENFDQHFADIARSGDVLISGFNFGCGSSREQAATAILAKKIPMVVAGSFGNIFSRNSINNGLLGLEIPKLVHRLRERFSNSSPQVSVEDVCEPTLNRESLDSPPPAPQTTPVQGDKLLTRRTGWHFIWDVARSTVTIREDDGRTWSEGVSALPPNVQEIIACGGLEKWVKKEIDAGS
ncbi:MAG: mitochondrial Homoaconitase [Alectoria sarmentosa]|nr:MAG: mitochondrial Homoaconitase [Alectoria sarmentosa]